ncbi:MAG: alpha/beta hydrolase [Clostridia bacterium]|nr:alpha/beta hydrolase [Clostridia bacterium]
MKYNISSEFGFIRHFAPSLNPVFLRLASVGMNLLPKGLNKNKLLDISKHSVICRDGKSIKIYVIKPKYIDNKVLPCIVYYPGGGFVFKPAPYHYRNAMLYAEKTRSVVILVEYRLSYNTPFNTPLNDAYDAYNFVLNNSESLNIDKSHITIAGDSAGAYLALNTLVQLNSNNLPLPVKMMLIYPVIDSLSNTKSMLEYVDTPVWNAKLNKKMWQIYKKGNALDSVMDAKDLSYIPLTYIETCEFDCLRDEGIEFYNKISKFNKNNILYNTKNTMHGYDFVKNSTITQESLNKRIKFLNTKEK